MPRFGSRARGPHLIRFRGVYFSLKGSIKNNLAELAPRFMLDLFDLKPQKLME